MWVDDLVGERALLKVRTGRYGGDAVDEYRILEVAPSGSWVKLQNLHGAKFWRAITDISFVEALVDLRARRHQETGES